MNEFFNLSPTVLCAVGGAVILLVIILLIIIISKSGSKKNNKKIIDEIAGKAVKNYDTYSMVIASRNGVKVNNPEEQGGEEREEFPYYLYLFRKWDSYAIPFDFKGKNVATGDVIEISPRTTSEIKIRYMRTNARFYDLKGNEMLEFTVAAIDSSEVAPDCPFRIEQAENANEFFEYIESFSKRLDEKYNRN